MDSMPAMVCVGVEANQLFSNVTGTLVPESPSKDPQVNGGKNVSVPGTLQTQVS